MNDFLLLDVGSYFLLDNSGDKLIINSESPPPETIYYETPIDAIFDSV